MMFTLIVGTHLPALHSCCKVKVIEVCVKAQHIVSFRCLFLQKYHFNSYFPRTSSLF
nr:MAG TPA: hypothetical protein [Caudoviricetes sp.]